MTFPFYDDGDAVWFRVRIVNYVLEHKQLTNTQPYSRQLPKNLRLSFSYWYRGLWSCSSVLDIHKQIPNSVDDIIHINCLL